MPHTMRIAPEVQTRLGPDGVAELAHVLEHGARCHECGRQITDPDADVAVSIEVFANSPEGVEDERVYVTHPACAPSQIRAVPGTLDDRAAALAERGGAGLVYTLGLWGGDPHGLVIWELTSPALAYPRPDEPIDLAVASYLDRGWTLPLSVDQLAHLPLLRTWKLELDPPRLLIRDPDDLPALDGTLDVGPPEWETVVRTERQVLAVTGANLISRRQVPPAALEAAVRAGRVAAARIPLARHRT